MMKNVALPPPYSVVVNASTPSSDEIITQPEVIPKKNIDKEPLVAQDHPFDDKFVRVAFMQKIVLFLLLQAIAVLAIMAPMTVVYLPYFYSQHTIYVCVFVYLYLILLAILYVSDTWLKKNPYKTILFTAYPIVLAVLLSVSTLDYSIKEMVVAWSCYCIALFTLLTYTIMLLQTSLEYRPAGGIFISTVVLVSLFVLTSQIRMWNMNTTYIFYYMIAMLADCSYTVWAVYLITTPKYRNKIIPSDIIHGVLFIRIGFIYFITMYIKKLLRVKFSHHVGTNMSQSQTDHITDE